MPGDDTAPQSALSLFHPLVRGWFTSSVGTPTDVQEKAWPAIARGEHVLVSAPTGTGKTLAAFLWGMDRLATGAWDTGKVRILYVSPLKALNADIRRNLLAPLAALEERFRAAAEGFPRVRVLTRSGDTPASERRRMLADPPEILITTPESLNLILSSAAARGMLDGLALVILDEIHAVAGSKRGTHLVTAVDRLVRLAGEFQRVALSATVHPRALVADFAGGFRRIAGGAAGSALFEKRKVTIVACPLAKSYDLSIRFPAPAAASSQPLRQPGPDGAPGDRVWDRLAAECRALVQESRSTLLFVNSRRHAEKLARLINEGAGERLAWAHHGSLSRELRLVVEERLKRGELRAIVATSSLELGIDIGSLDRVVLVQTPFSVSSAVQRIGRAGHGVGQASSAVVFPLHGRDILEAAVTVAAVREQDIEAVAPVECPLDVLAQLIVSMTCVETRQADELFDEIRASFPYRNLTRGHYDLVLGMLVGRYEEKRLRALAPLVSIDPADATIRAREGARIRLVTGGGTIPDRGYLGLRTADTGALLGELDEEFVWERAVGDSFVLGTQGWRITRIGSQDVEVVPASSAAGMSPFWKAEERNRDFHLSERIAGALESWTGRLEDPGFAEELVSRHDMDDEAARALVDWLRGQKQATGCDLPHRHHLVVEHVRARGEAGGPGKSAGCQLVLHAPWGGRVTRPWSLALAAAWEERWGERPAVFQNDDSILVTSAEARSAGGNAPPGAVGNAPPGAVGNAPPGAGEVLGLVTSGNLERLLRKSLESSGFFGARFRENAARALLLPRASARRRTPLWLTRERAKSLLAAVSVHDDFPILLETWRTCLCDEFDMPHLVALLDEVAGGTVRVSEVTTAGASPFCADVVRRQENLLMYADDTPKKNAPFGAGGNAGTALRADLVREIALSSDLRPLLPAGVVSEFLAKVQRTADGYAPRDAREMRDWIAERILLPASELEEILRAGARDGGVPAADMRAALAARIVEGNVAERGPGALPCAAAVSVLPRLRRSRAPGGEEELAGIVSEWLRFYGPVEPGFIAGAFGLAGDRLALLLEDLVEEQAVVLDRLVQGSPELMVCDRENLERLLRMTRSARRGAAAPALPVLPAEKLPLFAAVQHGLAGRGPRGQGQAADELKTVMERLFGLALPVRLWEQEVLPARIARYQPRALDSLMRESGLAWFGAGEGRTGFCLAQEAELFLQPPAPADAARCDELIPGGAGRYGFWDLAGRLGMKSSDLAEELWSLAWKGLVSNDSFQTVRKGIAGGFRAVPAAAEAGRRRAGLDRWQASRPADGYWFRLERAGTGDALEDEEATRDRVRQVLRRHGVVFRELLEHELPGLRWARLFRSLRLMEFSGEAVAGRFFKGVQGLQFAAPAALGSLAALAGEAHEDAVYWMNAADPASLAGAGLEALKGLLPPRLPTTHVAFHGSRVVIVSRRLGRDFEIRVEPGSPCLPRCLGFVRALVGREVSPLSAVHVITVNGKPAAASPYAPDLLAFGFVRDFGRLSFRPGFGAGPAAGPGSTAS